MRAAISAFNSQSKLMSIYAHLSLSLLFEFTKSCHLTKSRCPLRRAKFHDLPRLCETQPSAAPHFRRHEIFGHRDSQPDSKSIFSCLTQPFWVSHSPASQSPTFCFWKYVWKGIVNLYKTWRPRTLFLHFPIHIVLYHLVHHDFIAIIHSFLHLIRIFRNSSFSRTASNPACCTTVSIPWWLDSRTLNLTWSYLSSRRSGSM